MRFLINCEEGLHPPFLINRFTEWTIPMKVDLNKFFEYYDSKNPKHVAAVDEFEKSL